MEETQLIVSSTEKLCLSVKKRKRKGKINAKGEPKSFVSIFFFQNSNKQNVHIDLQFDTFWWKIASKQIIVFTFPFKLNINRNLLSKIDSNNYWWVNRCSSAQAWGVEHSGLNICSWHYWTRCAFVCVCVLLVQCACDAANTVYIWTAINKSHRVLTRAVSLCRNSSSMWNALDAGKKGMRPTKK